MLAAKPFVAVAIAL